MKTATLGWLIVVSTLLLGACASMESEESPLMSAEIAEGSNSKFTFTVVSTAESAQIWELWTDVHTWGEWDGGLQSASITGAFELGAEGQLKDLSGRSSKFTVVAFDQGQSYTFSTKLPLASLEVERQLSQQVTEGSEFTHTVSFTGPLGRLFAQILGPSFRRELPSTMRRLANLAEEES